MIYCNDLISLPLWLVKCSNNFVNIFSKCRCKGDFLRKSSKQRSHHLRQLKIIFKPAFSKPSFYSMMSPAVKKLINHHACVLWLKT